MIDGNVYAISRTARSFAILLSISFISRLSVISRSSPGGPPPLSVITLRTTSTNSLRASWMGDTLTATRGGCNPLTCQR